MSQPRSTGGLRILCEAAPDFGVSAELCLEGTGLSTFDLYDSETTVTLAQELSAIRSFLNHAPARDGLATLIARRYRPEVFGIWGYAILSSPNVRAALKTAMDFANLSFVISRFELDEEDDSALMIYDTQGLSPRLKAFILERQIAVMMHFSEHSIPRIAQSNLKFETTLTDPKFAASMRKMLGIKVELNAAQDALILPKSFLDTPMPQHDPAKMEYALRRCKSLLNISDEDAAPVSSKVREATLLDINNDPTITSIAAKLGIGERTLRRRLAAEGTSFRQIYVEARMAIGHELLSTAGLDVATVAWRTGYSEASSFVRAFTKQYGYSPGSLKGSSRVSIPRLS